MGNRARKFTILCTLVVLGSLLVGEAVALSPHNREGWLLGVAVGFGRGEVTFGSNVASSIPDLDGDRVTSNWERGIVPQYRIGHVIFKNRLMLSFDNRQWLYENSMPNPDPDTEPVADKVRVNVQSWTFNLTFYPGNPYSAAGGLYIQAGTGWSNSRLTFLDAVPDAPDDHGNYFEEAAREDNWGSFFSAVAFAFGYEFRVVGGVAAGLALNYQYQAPEGATFDSSHSFPLTLNLNWYW